MLADTLARWSMGQDFEIANNLKRIKEVYKRTEPDPCPFLMGLQYNNLFDAALHHWHKITTAISRRTGP